MMAAPPIAGGISQFYGLQHQNFQTRIISNCGETAVEARPPRLSRFNAEHRSCSERALEILFLFYQGFQNYSAPSKYSATYAWDLMRWLADGWRSSTSKHP
jgi:hypothetical protein